MDKDFIISTIAEIEGYPCDNMIGNVDIAEFICQDKTQFSHTIIKVAREKAK